MTKPPPKATPLLLQAGFLCGILKGSPQNPQINSDWFSHPLSYLKNIKGSQLNPFLKTLLGDFSGNALGGVLNTLQRTWFPIPIPDPEEGGKLEHLGFYITSLTQANKNTVWGPGFLKTITETLDSKQISITPFAVFPVLEIMAGKDGFNTVLGAVGHPIEIGVEIKGPNGIFGGGTGNEQVSFDGINVAVTIDFVAAPKLEFVLQNLLLPGETKPSNRSLHELMTQVPLQEWIETVLVILGAQFSKSKSPVAADIGRVILDLITALGLNGDLPGPDWEALPEKGVKVFEDWIRKVVSKPATLESWLNAWADTFQAKTIGDTGPFTGSGTRLDPFKILLHDFSSIGELYFTIGVASAGKNAFGVYPGLAFDSTAYTFIANKAEVLLQASLELFELLLPASDTTPIPIGAQQFFPALDLVLIAQNPTAGTLLIDYPTPGNSTASGNDAAVPSSGLPLQLQLGSVQAGLSYSELTAKGGPRHLHPSFNLIDVEIGGGKWPIIDLTNFNKDVKIAGEAISELVQAELNSLTGTAGQFIQHLAAVIGILRPTTYLGKSWPIKLLIDQIPEVIEHPITALGVYYSSCLSETPVNNTNFFTYLLPDLVALLGSSSTKISGTGTAATDPWQIEIYNINETAQINLEAWKGESANELDISLGFLVPVTIDGFSFSFELNANLLDIQLPAPDGSGSFGADWLPGVNAQLKVPKSGGLNYKLFGKVPISVSTVLFEGGWHRDKDLYFEGAIEGLNINNQKKPFPNIVFATFSKNGSIDLGTFAQAILTILGLETTLYGGRAGATINALLGLAPSAFESGNPQNVWQPPKGISLPASWPGLKVSDPSTFFTQPWADLRAQLSAVFSTDELSIPMLQFIGWALTGEVPEAPKPAQKGSVDDPWTVSFSNHLNPLVWLDNKNKTVNFGVQRILGSWGFKDIQVGSRIELAGASIAQNTTHTFSFVPQINVITTLSNPAGKSDPLLKGSPDSPQIGYAEIGLSISAEGIPSPYLKLYNAGLNTGRLEEVVELTIDSVAKGSYTSAQGLQLLEGLMNSLINYLSKTVQGPSAVELKALLNLLLDINILQSQPADPGAGLPAYSFNPSSWKVFLANPATYLEQQMEAVLENEIRSTRFFASLARLLGFQHLSLPAPLQGLLTFLEVFGLVEKGKAGYKVIFAKVMELIKNPITFLEELPGAAEDNILNNAPLRKKLIAALSHLPKPHNLSGLQLSLLTGDKIRLGLTEDVPLPLGLGIEMEGALVIDLKNLSLSIDLLLGIEKVGIELVFEDTLEFSDHTQVVNTWSLDLQAIAPAGATASSITLISSTESKKDITALAEQILLLLLSTVTADVLNYFLLPKSKLLQNLFTALGLTLPPEEVFISLNQTPVVGSLASIFAHPAQWLLSPAVLGNNEGRIDLSRIGKLLNALPGPAGISLKGNEDIKLLPYKDYGMELSFGTIGDVSFRSSDASGVSIGLVISPTLDIFDIQRISIAPQLNFGADGGIHISGDLLLTFAFGKKGQPAADTKTLTIHLGYHTNEFDLSIFGLWDDKPYGPLNFLPFKGISQFLEQSIITLLSDKITEKLQSKGVSPYFKHLAALTGIIAPTALPSSLTWPLAKEGMLLSGSQIGSLIKNPLAALGGYFTRCLNTKITATNGPDLCWPYLLPDFAALFGSSTTTIPTGGTAADPWQIEIIDVDNTLMLWLQTWQPAGTSQELEIALGVSLPLDVETLVFTPEIQVQILQLSLPNAHNNGHFSATWMQGVNAEVSVAQKQGNLTFPILKKLGLDSSLKSFNILFGWRNHQGLYFDAVVDGLTVNGEPIPTLVLGTDTTDWSAELEELELILLNILGTNLVRHAGKTGMFVTALLGLLPDMAAVLNNKTLWTPPAGVTFTAPWPEIKTVLGTEFFENPWVVIRHQIVQLLNPDQGKNIEAMLQFLFWIISGEVLPSPTTLPSGKAGDPWQIVYPKGDGASFQIWNTGSVIEFGVEKAFSPFVNKSKTVKISTKVDIQGIGLSAQTPFAPFVQPQLLFTANFSNLDGPSSPLIDIARTGTQIGSFEFGCSIMESGISVVLNFSSVIYKGQKYANLSLTPSGIGHLLDSGAGIEVLNELLAIAIAFLSKEVQGTTAAEDQVFAFLNLLVQFGILQETTAPNASDVYTLETANWALILNNAPKYFLEVLDKIYLQPDTFASVAQSVEALIKISLPDIPKGVDDLLFAFGLLEQAHLSATEVVLVPDLPNWVALFQNPVAYLNTQAGQLFSNATLLNTLIQDLKSIVHLPDWITITVGSNNQIDVQVDIEIEKELKIGIDLSLIVAHLQFSSQLTLGVAGFPSVLAFSNTFTTGKQAARISWDLSLQEQSPNLDFPAAELTLISSTQLIPDIEQLAVQVPIWLLSDFTRLGLNNYLLPKSQLAQNIFESLGIAKTEGTSKIPVAGPLYSLFLHPVAWLEKEFTINNGENLNWTNIGSLLNAIPKGVNFSEQSISLTPVSDGLKVGITKWGSIQVTSDTNDGIILNPVFNPSLPDHLSVSLSSKLSYSPTAKDTFASNTINVSASGNLSYPVVTGQVLGIGVGYGDKGFSITLNGISTPPVELFPFKGLEQFFHSPGADQVLLAVANIICKVYEKEKPKLPAELTNFVNKLVSVAADFQITNLKELNAALVNLISNPIGWVKTWFEEKIGTSLGDLYALLGTLNLAADFQYTQGGSILTFQPQTDAFSVQFGQITFDNNTQPPLKVLGVWLSAPINTKYVDFGIKQTGVGLKLPVTTVDLAAFKFTVDADLTINLPNIPATPNPNLPSPTFNLGYDSTEFPNQFFLNLSPVQKTISTNTLLVDFLPHPQLAYGGDPSKAVPVLDWLLKFTLDFMIPSLADTVLQDPAVNQWLNVPLKSGSKVTRGSIPVNWGLLTKPGSSYGLNLAFYQNVSPDPASILKIIEKILFETLKTFLKVESPFTLYTYKKAYTPPALPLLITFSVISEQITTKGVSSLNYGVGVQVQNFSIVSDSAKGPDVSLQIGSWMTGGIDAANWINNTDGSKDSLNPGLNIYLINDKYSIEAPIIELVSVGVDITGANKKPLFDIKGYTLAGVEPRAYLSLNTGDPGETKFGFGVRADDFGMALGPGFGKSGGDQNPVAKNLLSSGVDPKNGKTNAINPDFSFRASYVDPADFKLNFYNANNQLEDEVWLPVNKKFGPIHCVQFGIGFDNAKELLLIGFDGDVSLAGLNLNLKDLNLGIPVEHPLDFDGYTFGLQGMDLTFKENAVDISGGLFKTGSGADTGYDGELIIQVENFNLSALGAYSRINGHPSLFLFMLIDVPLGGPSFFFVTGLAGGFGFNRNLILPGQDQVAGFPLVAGALNPAVTFPSGGSSQKGVEGALNAMEKYIPPKYQEYWLAAGVRFTSFELIQSFALVTVAFGVDFELALIGISRLAIPNPNEDDDAKPIIFTELDVEVRYSPAQGILAVSAVINPNSYLLDQDCRLQGGFAFYIWFKDQPKGAQAGDFVVTLGGYNPDYNPRPWYPSEPRLGFNWAVSKHLKITGGLYFALTSNAIMMGGSLDIIFQAGPVRAWFDAYANFLLEWAPLGYQVSIGISIGVSVNLKLFTVKLELGASVDIQGKPFGGIAKVHVLFFTVTIKFGTKGNPVLPGISWDKFMSKFLPAAQKPAMGNAAAVTSNPPSNYVKINILTGLLTKITKGSTTYYIVNGHELAITTHCVIPSTKYTLTLGKKSIPNSYSGQTLYVRPMKEQNTALQATHQVTISVEDSSQEWESTLIKSNVPASMWGQWNGRNTPDLNPKQQLIPDTLTGLQLRPNQKEPAEGVGPFPIINLDKHAVETDTFSWDDGKAQSPANQPDEVFKTISKTLQDEELQQERAQFLTFLAKGLQIDERVELSLMAAYPQRIFRGTPILSDLGTLPTQESN